MEMPPLEIRKKNFFISYSKADRPWAEWIAWQLREAGHTIVLQAWDFLPGANFPLEMDKAIRETKRTIAVLSSNYTASAFTASEWAAIFRQDPTGTARKLVPVRVQECKPDGLLAQLIYIDLVGLPEEAARKKLLKELTSRSGMPMIQPPYPGNMMPKPRFPGNQSKTIKKPSQTPIQKKSHWNFWTVIGLLIAIGLAIWGLSWGFSSFISYTNYTYSPAYKLDQFCTNMQQHQWDRAYLYFDESLTKKVTEAQFAASILTVANKHDNLGSCSYRIDKQIGSIAHIKITYMFGDGYVETKQYDLFQDPIDGWSLDKWTF